MVFFSCDNCGGSLKKNQVEKHRYSCYGTLCCIDCNKDFHGNDYVNHTKCISEIERYSAKGWKPPSNFNKGEKKQEAWVELVQTVVQNAGSTLKPATRNLLLAISKHDNVPRKKAKLINFVQNVTRRAFDLRTIEEVWTLLEIEWNKAKKQDEKPTTTNTLTEPKVENGTSNEAQIENEEVDKKEKKKEKKKKRKELESGQLCNQDQEQEQPPENEPKKKKNKRKEIELESDPLTQETEPIQEENQDPLPPKKKKKRKEIELESDPLTQETEPIQEENQDQLPPKKKKKKSKHSISEDN